MFQIKSFRFIVSNQSVPSSGSTGAVSDWITTAPPEPPGPAVLLGQ
jgi:hypothetical protein